jgi:hypothetical protein
MARFPESFLSVRNSAVISTGRNPFLQAVREYKLLNALRGDTVVRLRIAPGGISKKVAGSLRMARRRGGSGLAKSSERDGFQEGLTNPPAIPPGTHVRAFSNRWASSYVTSASTLKGSFMSFRPETEH